MYRILFATSEAYPLIKTGGLGDVAGALPPALQSLGCDVRLVLPAYRDALIAATDPRPIGRLRVAPDGETVDILETGLPGTATKVWLLAYAPAFDRPGNPYLSADGQPWSDNAMRFALFGRAVTALALGRAGLDWQPQLVHTNDWQGGLVPALLALEAYRPATVFTIHNLSYQGLFPSDTFTALGLPARLWSAQGLEFHGQLSFIKGGLVFADHLTTVSPTYAREIQMPTLGFGLDGLLRHRADRLTGILNGIDVRAWNPTADTHLIKPYGLATFADKRENKLALQRECGLTAAEAPLIGSVGRLVEQKGSDILIDSLPSLIALGAQVVVLGSGERRYESALRALASAHRGRLSVHIGYDEALAHRIEAGADMFLMPSRFEPCGLSQLYSLRYGTVPIVHRVGGLVDTVVDASASALTAGTATGVVFDEINTQGMVAAVERAMTLYRQPRVWQKIALTGMQQSFSWSDSARRYLELYARIIASRGD
jgi:starch synthase